MKKQQVPYTKEAAIHAKVLISQGWTNKQIRDVDVCKDIPFRILRQWRFRMNETPETLCETANETPDKITETLNCNAGTASLTQPENVGLTFENSVSPVSETPQSVSKRSVLREFFTRHFSRMDAVFYIATAAACYSFWYAVPGIPGATFAALYWLLAFDALHRVKASGENEALAKSAEVRVWGCEVWASVAHWNIINEYLWHNLDKLPFDVKAVPQGGTWVLDYTGAKTNIMWQNGDFVGLIAAVLSCSICAAVIVAVGTTFQASKQAGK